MIDGPENVVSRYKLVLFVYFLALPSSFFFFFLCLDIGARKRRNSVLSIVRDKVIEVVAAVP